MKTYVCLILALCSLMTSATWADVKLPAVISDNMVLQQGMKVPIWGKAAAGEKVAVTFGDHTASATADASGRWRTTIGPFKAGGPFTMTVAGKNTLTIRNILVGEVWVASGQSNMEMMVSQAANAPAEIAAAGWPKIRLFTVGHAVASKPLEDVAGNWSECSPTTVGNFSATAYYFGRELHRRLGVPVGLINASWSGTLAEPWTSVPSLRAEPKLKPIIDRYDAAVKDFPAAKAAYRKKYMAWEAAVYPNDEGNKGATLGYAKPGLDLSGWKDINQPGAWEGAGLCMDGAVWLRKDVEVPAAWAGKELLLGIGMASQYDTTYYNGVEVGSVGPEKFEEKYIARWYKVPGNLVKAGKVTVAVRVFNQYGGGGLVGMAEWMRLSLPNSQKDVISLAGAWKYKIEKALPPTAQPRSFPPTGTSPTDYCQCPGVLFNGMISPLMPYGIAGAIWYQGESNSQRAWQYRTLLPTMIRDWRTHWGQGDFPFLIAQLAMFGPEQWGTSESFMAELREAQWVTSQSVPKTGLATALATGGSLHPINKQEIGRRLALTAMSVAYGDRKVVFSGPTYDRMTIDGDKATLSFRHVHSGLVALKAEPKIERIPTSTSPALKDAPDRMTFEPADELRGFTVAGADRKFFHAQARIEGDRVVVWSKDVPKPVAVRYAWEDVPQTTLFNKEGMPALPFRTDNWPAITLDNE